MPIRAAIAPGFLTASRFISSPLFMANLRASSIVTTPEEKRAAYSPTLWPATISASIPASLRREKQARANGSNGGLQIFGQCQFIHGPFKTQAGNGFSADVIGLLKNMLNRRPLIVNFLAHSHELGTLPRKQKSCFFCHPWLLKAANFGLFLWIAGLFSKQFFQGDIPLRRALS